MERTREVTGRRPPPTPHTLSSRVMPCFMASNTSARARACLQIGIKMNQYGIHF